MRTLEQEYNYIKSQFISLSRSIHLGYNTYDPLFTVAADAVRATTKSEPIHNGNRRDTESNTAAQMLVGYMITNTTISRAKLAEMMGKKSHSTVYHNLKEHYAKMQTNKEYDDMYNKVVNEVKDTDLCNTSNT